LSAISVNSQQQINLLHPASSFLAGHLNDTSLQHLPGLLGVRLIKRDRGADPVRSRWRLYRACRRWEKQRAAPKAKASWVKLCPGHRPPPSPISEIDASGTFLEDRLWYARPPNQGTSRYLKGCRLRGRSPVGAIAADAAAMKNWVGPLQPQKRRSSSR